MSNELIREIKSFVDKFAGTGQITQELCGELTEIVSRHENDKPESLEELARRKNRGLVYEIYKLHLVCDMNPKSFNTEKKIREYLSTLPDVKEEGR